jgi:two-component system, NarL family, nitrate/nitrite response regulator NarL
MQSCLICDDHALVREALVGAVKMNWPSAVVTEASDFPQAWALARNAPDFCIADLIMPGATPLEGIKGIMKAAPNTPILVVTGTQDDALLLGLLKLGVAGFAPKSASGAIVEAAIRLILAGGRYLPPRLADIAAARVDSAREGDPSIVKDASLTSGPDPFNQAVLDRLTVRQIDVLKLVARGHSNKEIARTLGLAPSTVKTHLENLLAALGVANRTEASSKARSLNLL